MADPVTSNTVLLSPRQWLVTALVVCAGLAIAPRAWDRWETRGPGPDYRVPYELANDYWLYSRWRRRAAAEGKTLVVGDSVVWGQYVPRDQTLSHHLNRLAGSERFANLGLDGAHPVALAGLLRHYGRGVQGCDVILHCNLLWLSSSRRDLSTTKEVRFNHPRLAPQFTTDIPCYRESLECRLGTVAERTLGFLTLGRHMRLACYAGASMPAWTLDHPYSSPLSPLARREPASAKSPIDAAWSERGLRRQRFPWVSLEHSVQWRFFRRTLALLQRRGNRVFVVVGPLNQHMLAEQNLGQFRELRQAVQDWLDAHSVLHCVPPVLPSELYADAGHPLAAGYERLARRLWAEAFVSGAGGGNPEATPEVNSPERNRPWLP